MGFAGMARVLTDKKANSLIGLSTGTNIVRSVKAHVVPSVPESIPGIGFKYATNTNHLPPPPQ